MNIQNINRRSLLTGTGAFTISIALPGVSVAAVVGKAGLEKRPGAVACLQAEIPVAAFEELVAFCDH